MSMEKSSTSSLSSVSSRELTGRAPVPLPRTKFMAEPDNLNGEKGRKTPSKRKDGKREHKPKGTYSMIKDLLPGRKSKNPDKVSEKSDRSAKFHRNKPEVPPRPKHSKHRQYNPNRNDEAKDKEYFPNKYGSSEKRESNLKTSQSERSLQTIFPSPSSQRLSEVDHSNDPLLAVLAPSSMDDRANRNVDHGAPHSPRAPGLNLLSRVTTLPKITTKEQLVEMSQRAMECIQDARGASSNAQYNKAARKYQQSLDMIDNVLETPLNNLHLTEEEEDKAQQTLFELRLLRKDALQGFSDSQCQYSLPQSTLNLPAGAPPSYNDVLKEDLLMFTPTTASGSVPLVPSLINDRRASRKSELVSADPRATHLSGSRYHSQQSPRIDSQFFYTPTISSPNPHGTRPMSQVPSASKSGPNAIVSQAVAPRPDKPARVRESTGTLEASGTSAGKQSVSVRPKVRQSPAHKKKPVFPPDVNVKTQKIKPGNDALDKLVPTSFGRSKKRSSNESLSSETSFKSALSTPKVTPRTKNIDRTDHLDMKNKPVHKYPALDPFSFEDPCPKEEPTRKPSKDAFSNLNGHSIAPSTKRLTQKESFIPSTSYHTEIIANKSTNPFANRTIESTSIASSAVNPFLHQPGDSALRGATSNNQFSEFRPETARPYQAGVIPAEYNSTRMDGHFSRGALPDKYSARELQPVAKNVPYEPSFSVDDSMLDDRKARKVNSIDPLSKRNRLTKSVVDLSAKKKHTSKGARKRRKLSKTKKHSRSNESILLMFDPIGVQHSQSSDTGSESGGDDFMVDKNTIQSNPVYGTNDTATATPSQQNGAAGIRHRENGGVGRDPGKPEQTNGLTETLLVIDSNEDEPPITSSPITNSPITSALITNAPITNAPITNAPITNGHTSESPERPRSLYPKLSVSEGLSSRPLPALPPLPPRQLDTSARRASGEARDRTTASVRGRGDEVSVPDAQDTKSVQSARAAQREKEMKTSKSKSSQESKNRSRHNIDEVEARAAVGRSAFYGGSSNQIRRPSFLVEVRARDRSPPAPHRSSSGGKDSPWQQILQINEAVKLFFLSEAAGVSSPFNRQSLLLLRKYGGGSGGEGDKARIEVGGELFARDLYDKNTMVMLDHHGDYIVQSSPDVFLCMVLCSKVKRSHAQALEKTFEIYANFAKESQMMRFPGGMESAAANVKKAVKDKAPGVMKTTSFVKRNSLRALRKLKGAIVGEDEEEEPKQELGIEYLPLKKACEKFREARLLKNVRYF